MSGTIKHLWALDAPTIATDCGLFQLGTGTQLAVPIPAFLIEHDLGLLMFDSGLDNNAAGDQPARTAPSPTPSTSNSPRTTGSTPN